MALDGKPQSKTSPSLSNYFDAFKQAERRPRKSRGDFIFNRVDIYKVNQNLARMLRYIFVMHGITWDEFTDKTVEYAGRLYYLPKDISTLRGNVRREVLKSKISFNKLEQFVSNILGLTFEDITLTLKDRSTGRTYVHSLSDIEKILSSLSEEEKRELTSNVPIREVPFD